MKEDRIPRLANLSELDDFELPSNQPDVRGWDVVSADGRRIGEVDDMLVDAVAGKVRYLDIDVTDDYRGSSTDGHVLIPVGRAQLDTGEDRVLVDEVRAEEFRTLPAHSGRFDRTYEDRVRRHFDTTPVRESDDFYGSPLFDDTRFYGTRRGTGGTGGRDSLDRDVRTRDASERATGDRDIIDRDRGRLDR